MYERILVPLDGSERAEAILPHVEALAHQFGSELILLQIFEPMAALVTPYDMFPYYDEEESERRQGEVAAYLDSLAQQLNERGIAARSLVLPGPIVNAILEGADQKDASLIAMASHGRTGLARVFYGSVTSGVLNQADRPLLIIRSSGHG